MVRCDRQKRRHEYNEHDRAVNPAERMGGFDATTPQDLGIMTLQGYGT